MKHQLKLWRGCHSHAYVLFYCSNCYYTMTIPRDALRDVLVNNGQRIVNDYETCDLVSRLEALVCMNTRELERRLDA